MQTKHWITFIIRLKGVLMRGILMALHLQKTPIFGISAYLKMIQHSKVNATMATFTSAGFVRRDLQ